MYYLAFPLGFTVSFLLHWCLNRIWPPEGLGGKDDIDYYGTFTNEEALRLGIAPHTALEGEDRNEAKGSEVNGKLGAQEAIEPL